VWQAYGVLDRRYCSRCRSRHRRHSYRMGLACPPLLWVRIHPPALATFIAATRNGPRFPVVAHYPPLHLRACLHLPSHPTSPSIEALMERPLRSPSGRVTGGSIQLMRRCCARHRDCSSATAAAPPSPTRDPCRGRGLWPPAMESMAGQLALTCCLSALPLHRLWSRCGTVLYSASAAAAPALMSD